MPILSISPGTRLLCVGLVGREVITTPQGGEEGWGGSALYAASAASAVGAEVTILTGLTHSDSTDVANLFGAATSDISLNAVRTEGSSRFLLAYTDDLELVEFSYSGGGLMADDEKVRLRSELIRLLEHDLVDHLHLCPLPAPVMSALAPVVLQQRVSFSLQIHFSEIESSGDWIRQLMKRATHVFMNWMEAAAILGAHDVATLSTQMRRQVGGTVFVTDRSGVWVVSSENVSRFASAPIQAIDPTGGGDAFAGGVLGRYLTDGDLRTCVNVGLALAGVAVSSLSSRGVLALSQTGFVH